MSSMGLHWQKIQESDDYRFGFESAERGEPRPNWKPIPGDLTQRFERQCIGWDDYYAQERIP